MGRALLRLCSVGHKRGSEQYGTSEVDPAILEAARAISTSVIPAPGGVKPVTLDAGQAYEAACNVVRLQHMFRSADDITETTDQDRDNLLHVLSEIQQKPSNEIG